MLNESASMFERSLVMLNESASIYGRSLARAAGSWLGKSDVLGALKAESEVCKGCSFCFRCSSEPSFVCCCTHHLFEDELEDESVGHYDSLPCHVSPREILACRAGVTQIDILVPDIQAFV